MSNENALKVKLCIVGNESVGKTCMVNRYHRKEFCATNATLGGAFFFHPVSYNGKQYELSIWDTAGSEKYRALVPTFYRQAKAAIVVYDITNRKSFDDIDSWVDDFKRKEPRVCFFTFCGNKSDCYEGRVVSKEEGQRKALEYDASFFETSALRDENINATFNDIIQRVELTQSISMTQSMDQWEQPLRLSMETNRQQGRQRQCCLKG